MYECCRRVRCYFVYRWWNFTGIHSKILFLSLSLSLLLEYHYPSIYQSFCQSVCLFLFSLSPLLSFSMYLPPFLLPINLSLCQSLSLSFSLCLPPSPLSFLPSLPTSLALLSSLSVSLPTSFCPLLSLSALPHSSSLISFTSVAVADWNFTLVTTFPFYFQQTLSSPSSVHIPLPQHMTICKKKRTNDEHKHIPFLSVYELFVSLDAPRLYFCRSLGSFTSPINC